MILFRIRKLLIIGKQCIAVICFERFCKKYEIKHWGIDEFVNQVWEITRIGAKDFDFEKYAHGFVEMPITGQGDLYPDDLITVIPENVMDDFNIFIQSIYEISAINWYCRYDHESTTRMFLEVLDVAKKHKIKIPSFNSSLNGSFDS